MPLTGLLTVLLAILLAVGAPVIAALLWNRAAAGPVVARWATRGGLLLLVQLTAIALVAVLINDANRFYTSWLELLGEHHTVTDPVAPNGNRDEQLAARLTVAAAQGHGIVVKMSIPGVHSHAGTFPALVYLPAAYGTPEFAHRQFPVVELIAGIPGSPESWTAALHVTHVLDTEIAAGRTTPLIAVMPSADIDGRRDTQCVDIVHGVAADTYLSSDVRAAVVGQFRAAPGPDSWGIMGYSSGGFCATNLAMRHPTLFGSAVSIAGYARPAHDFQTGDLFGKRTDIKNENTPIWRAQHLPPPDISVLLMASRPDPGTERDARELAAAAHPPFQVSVVELDHGGHNFEVWRAEEPVAFSWLSHNLIPPLAPQPVIDHRPIR